jgi:hypothetical protein
MSWITEQWGAEYLEDAQNTILDTVSLSSSDSNI